MSQHTNKVIEEISLYQSLIRKRQFQLAINVLSKIHGEIHSRKELASFFALENEYLQENGINFKALEYQNKLTTHSAVEQSSIRKERIDDEHDWYFNDEVAECVVESWRTKTPQLLPSAIHRLLVIGNNLDMSTGVFRPISHVLNFLHHHGGFHLRTIQFNNHTPILEISKIIESYDLIIINGIQQICHVKELTGWIENNCTNIPIYGYIHETKWIFNQLNQTEIQRLKILIRHSHILLCSQEQVRDISDLAQALSIDVVHNPTLCDTLMQHNKVASYTGTLSHSSLSSTTKVIMVGSIIRRKGYQFYSECAQAVNHNSEYTFQWIGKYRDTSIKINPKIDHPGEVSNHEVEMYLRKSNIFFLSSIDDTFPLVVVEAYINGCKLLLPKTTGIAEHFKNLSGVIIYEQHDVDHVVMRLKELQRCSEPSTEDQQFISRIFGLSAYLERFFKAINRNIPESHIQALGNIYDLKKNHKITIFLHLYHTDLVYELSRELEAIVAQECILIVTIPTSKSTPSSIKWLETIFIERFHRVYIIPCENRGLDIYPFFHAIEYLSKHDPEALNHDRLILKIHSKRSLTSSGQIKGNRWRRGLLKGLLGSRETCAKLIRLFESENALGLAAPEQFLMIQSTRDLKESNNQLLIDQLINHYEIKLAEEKKKFVRGTMFWSKSSLLIQKLTLHELPKTEDFLAGYHTDGTLAHAYERILSYLPLNTKSCLPIPKNNHYQYLTVEKLKNKEAGKSLSIYDQPFDSSGRIRKHDHSVSLCTSFRNVLGESQKLFDYGLLLEGCGYTEEKNALKICQSVIAVSSLKGLRSPKIYYVTDSIIKNINADLSLKTLSVEKLIVILSEYLGCVKSSN